MTETHTTSGAKRYTLIIIRIALSGCSIAPEVELIYPEIDNNPVMMAEVNPAPTFIPTELPAKIKLS